LLKEKGSGLGVQLSGDGQSKGIFISHLLDGSVAYRLVSLISMKSLLYML